MNRKYVGIVFLTLAFFAFAMLAAGSHGHIRFRPHLGEDWFFWGAMVFFTTNGAGLILRGCFKTYLRAILETETIGIKAISTAFNHFYGIQISRLNRF
ncbi:hypothetical protein ACXYMU_18770 [Pontibacter sp. CAU 1760]